MEESSSAAVAAPLEKTARACPGALTDPTALFDAFGGVIEGHPEDERFYGMPRCTTDALHELLHDDDPGEDIQYRAMYWKAADAIEALAEALFFARERLSTGSQVDQAHVRGINNILSRGGLELSPPKHRPTSNSDVAIAKATQPPASRGEANPPTLSKAGA